MYFLLYNYTSCFILQLIPRENYGMPFLFSLYRVLNYYYSATADTGRATTCCATTSTAPVSGTRYTSTVTAPRTTTTRTTGATSSGTTSTATTVCYGRSSY
jgi:hypothetical protein